MVEEKGGLVAELPRRVGRRCGPVAVRVGEEPGLESFIHQPLMGPAHLLCLFVQRTVVEAWMVPRVVADLVTEINPSLQHGSVGLCRSDETIIIKAVVQDARLATQQLIGQHLQPSCREPSLLIEGDQPPLLSFRESLEPQQPIRPQHARADERGRLDAAPSQHFPHGEDTGLAVVERKPGRVFRQVCAVTSQRSGDLRAVHRCEFAEDSVQQALELASIWYAVEGENP